MDDKRKRGGGVVVGFRKGGREEGRGVEGGWSLERRMMMEGRFVSWI
jgi:hypothetical protein